MKNLNSKVCCCVLLLFGILFINTACLVKNKIEDQYIKITSKSTNELKTYIKNNIIYLEVDEVTDKLDGSSFSIEALHRNSIIYQKDTNDAIVNFTTTYHYHNKMHLRCISYQQDEKKFAGVDCYFIKFDKIFNNHVFDPQISIVVMPNDDIYLDTIKIIKEKTEIFSDIQKKMKNDYIYKKYSIIISKKPFKKIKMNAQHTAFSIKNLKKIVPPNKVILNDINLSFFYGAKIGVIGVNGAGKSTLLRVIAGTEKDFEGELKCDKNLTIGHLPQEPLLDSSISISENIMQGMKKTLDDLKLFEELSTRLGEELDEKEMNDVMEKMGEVQETLDKKNAWEIERTTKIAMEALRVPSDEHKVENLSGGERRRVSLCRLLIESPDILILDEPTNHLDAESVAWLESYLKKFLGTVLIITHDRYFLDNLADWILELDRGNAYPYKGNYKTWLKNKNERLKQEEKTETKKLKSIKRELDWLNQNNKAQQSKNKARIKAYENLLVNQNQIRSIEKMEINLPIPPRLGEKVIDIKNLSKKYGNKQLINNLSISIPRGAIVGIIGPNGVGKSTLFKLITNIEKPDKGTIEIGETVKFSHVEQFRDSLSANDTIWQAISEGEEQINLGDRLLNSRAYVGSFNFKGQEQQKRIGSLSGGERNRVHLARLLKSGGNVLLLDEPTNDLDINTLRSLEDALLSFAGCVLVISHDRYFLDRITTHILSFESDQRIEYRMGNFNEYEEWKMRTLNQDTETKS